MKKQKVNNYEELTYQSNTYEQQQQQQAFLDIRLCPGRARNWQLVAAQAGHATPYGPLWPNLMSSIEPEVHNVVQRRQRSTKPRPQGICTQISCRSVQQFQRCSRTDRHTDRLVDRNTPHPYRGRVTIKASTTVNQQWWRMPDNDTDISEYKWLTGMQLH